MRNASVPVDMSEENRLPGSASSFGGRNITLPGAGMAAGRSPAKGLEPNPLQGTTQQERASPVAPTGRSLSASSNHTLLAMALDLG